MPPKTAKMTVPELRIHMWAVPRAISTATMYSFAQRSDTIVLDEPLYAHHLVAKPELVRPYRDQLLKEQKHDGNEVIADIMGPADKPIVFAKHMAKHVINLNMDFTHDPRSRHIILVRDPVDQLASWNNIGHEASLEETAIMDQVGLFSMLRQKGLNPIVVDSRILQNDPKSILTELCNRLGIPFEESMLKWEPGEKPYDGCWAYQWYKTAHTTTGFGRPGRQKTFPREMFPLLKECQPLYSLLRDHAIGGHASLQALDGKTINDQGVQLKPLPQEKNRDLLVFVGGRILTRALAKVSVFDSSVQGGDAVWENLWIRNGNTFRIDNHIKNLLNAAQALGFQDVPTAEYVKDAIYKTFAANGMSDDCEAKIILSRGEKTTASMNPEFNVYGTTLIVLAEWLPTESGTAIPQGIKLISSSGNSHQVSKINHSNLIGSIMARIQANYAGCDDVLTLDSNGYVTGTISGNIFCVKDGTLLTPNLDTCQPGIFRDIVFECAKPIGVMVAEQSVVLSQVYSADEVFITSTKGNLIHVGQIDGRMIGDGTCGTITKKLQDSYRDNIDKLGERLPHV